MTDPSPPPAAQVKTLRMLARTLVSTGLLERVAKLLMLPRADGMTLKVTTAVPVAAKPPRSQAIAPPPLLVQLPCVELAPLNNTPAGSVS